MADEFRSRPASGTVLGERFRLERVIGVGGMASVWLARDQELDRPVAVKILSEALAEDRDYVVRFGREARTAGSVAHPNLVNVFDYQASGPRPYLVMEYVEGETLAELIERGTDLDPARVARELLSALRAIHDAGIVHRDVKPENVLIGVDGRMRLTDFGIAHPEDATRLTQTGEVIGTARFMAPELRAGGDPTVRSDLYSLGVLLREACRSEAAAHVVELAAHLSRPAPGERPRSASEALAALERGIAPEETTELTAVEGRSGERVAEPAVEEAPAGGRRRLLHVSHARLVAAALALVAALVLATVVLDDDARRGGPLIGPAAKPNPLATERAGEGRGPR